MGIKNISIKTPPVIITFNIELSASKKRLSFFNLYLDINLIINLRFKLRIKIMANLIQHLKDKILRLELEIMDLKTRLVMTSTTVNGDLYLDSTGLVNRLHVDSVVITRNKIKSKKKASIEKRILRSNNCSKRLYRDMNRTWQRL